MITILSLIVTALVLTVGEGRAAEGDAPELPVIGIISSGPTPGAKRGMIRDYLLQSLKDLGYVDGSHADVLNVFLIHKNQLKVIPAR